MTPDTRKTAEQIDAARRQLAKRLLTPDLSSTQLVLLTGMLNALVWAAGGENGSTIDRLVSGEPIGRE